MGKFLLKHCKNPSLKYDFQEEFNEEKAVQYMIKSIMKVKALELKTAYFFIFEWPF